MIKIDSNINMREYGSHYFNGFLDFLMFVNKNIRTCNTIIEIGSFKGESSSLILKHIHGNPILYCVDPWNDMPDNSDILQGINFSNIEKIFDETLISFNNFKKIKSTSDEFIQSNTINSVDLVYIDGLHTYDQVKRDIENYLPLIKSGGILAGHDYHIPIPHEEYPFYYDIDKQQKIRHQVGLAVDELLLKDYKIYTFEDTSWAIIKK